MEVERVEGDGRDRGCGGHGIEVKTGKEEGS